MGAGGEPTRARTFKEWPALHALLPVPQPRLPPRPSSLEEAAAAAAAAPSCARSCSASRQRAISAGLNWRTCGQRSGGTQAGGCMGGWRGQAQQRSQAPYVQCAQALPQQAA